MNMAQAFDEWMRRYKRNPEQFSNEMAAARAHRKRKRNADASEYGQDCAVYLRKLMRGVK